ncbi:MAG: cellulase family glycosylhydrolase [Caldilineaceae bacterium]|nr:cellulase family glycosylhydrolase [Caldilineaceae bacterium]MBP8107074.1 cellulase family glycosylhydrolase [Caldilineaceae bacterium]MBP8121112.1 cellulase family glycosylhydrolase [Caldilineaceae bacterium]MBP9070771.1 cellulase family glycosylhydrolase [Caldilineaceae bacterium]
MRKTIVKLTLWAILGLILAAAALWSVNGAARLAVYFKQGADPASALNIVPNVPQDFYVKLDWLPDDPDTGRKIDPFTRTQVESAYLRAWLQWNISYLRGHPYGLETYFTGPALDAAESSVSTATSRGWQIAQADTEHELTLHFYAADGSIASFTDARATVAQLIRDAEGNAIYAGEGTAVYDVVMMLEDGNWRVRHWLRVADVTEGAGSAGISRPNFVGVRAGQLWLDEQPFEVAGINYYPKATPWDEFWPNYDPAVTAADFAHIRALGLNTVRVFVPYVHPGGPKVDPAILDGLGDLLDQAEDQGLKVIVTLFDFRGDYNILLWPNADRHMETLLTTFRDHPAILAWDLKNEADLDYDSAGQTTVDAWLLHIARLARRLDPNHLLTVGWSSPEAAAVADPALADLLDLVSFHFYAPAVELADRYAALRVVALDRPILLGEFGLPTWNSPLFPHGHTEAEQAVYYADLLTALGATDAAGSLAWTLYDFEHVPATVAGRWPWQTGPQRQLGLLRGDDTPKPAAALLAPGADLTVPPLPAYARLLKPFWLTVLAGLILAPLLLGALTIWYLRRRVG